MKTYELKDLKIEGVDDCFVKYAQIKHIQSTHHKGFILAMRNGVTKLCQDYYSEKGFTPQQFIKITNKVIGECPPFTVIDNKMYTSIDYGIWNSGPQLELVKDLTEYESEVIITNCDNYHDGYNKMQKDQIAKAVAAIKKMREDDIYTLNDHQ